MLGKNAGRLAGAEYAADHEAGATRQRQEQASRGREERHNCRRSCGSRRCWRVRVVGPRLDCDLSVAPGGRRIDA